METHHDRIGLLDFGRAALGLLPSAISSLWATLKVYALTPDSHQSIGSILEYQAENVPDKDCLLFEGQRWSYRDFNAWANRIAHVLKTHGVGPGDTVGLLFENCPELLACVAAVAKLGAVAGMLNPKQRGAVLSHSMRTIQPRLMVIGDGCLPALHSASPPQPKRAQAVGRHGAGASRPGRPARKTRPALLHDHELDVHSVTADSSGEFARLSTLVGASLYVRDTCKPNQRGSNENTILLFRQYQPKSEPSGLVTSRRIMRSSICQAIANVLAKASELPAEVRCRMRHCGRVSKQKSITSFQ